ncbi:MAG: hypothetical protein Kow0010_02850 [Dehalococcoidia bacterium]
MATPEQVAELLQKTREERARLVEAVRSLDREALYRVPVDAEGEEQWTALEQLAHLWEMERSYIAWVRLALDQENPDLSGVTGEPVAIPIEEANNATVDALLDALAKEREGTLALIESLPLDAFDRTATSPVFGTLTVLQWLRSFYRHDRQHTAQILGRKSDYQPRFRGQEPNQRRMRLEQVRQREQHQEST